MNHSFGLRQSDLTTICHALSKYPEVQQAYIFGSRAKGNYKNGSINRTGKVFYEIDNHKILNFT
ncbi:hypothetical protein SAMN04488541_10068 [Thermoflexibacter ruber]|uniref:Nucleotidyltransferase domain-containing protein n=1 Tax=Thermoflexibacter ruber TaxID=1003 RepID=A0A1I2D0N7_9BACT|nr:hypothetical protein SAMN04488541_10068 [Thermoflexibacter ruber]